MDKKILKNINYIRHAVQLVCFLFVPALFIEIFNSIKTVIFYFTGNGVTLENALSDGLLLIVVSLLTVFAGRFFCGWMCAFGAMQDFLYRIPRIKNKNPKKFIGKADKILKLVKYIILFIIVVFVWGLQIITIPAGVNPWEVFGMCVSPMSWPYMSDIIKMSIPATVILCVIIIGSLFIERFFCRFFCPLGAFFSIISRIRPVKVNKPVSECGKCSLCTKKCTMGIEASKMDDVKSGDCIMCMECVKHCPKSNSKLSIAGKKINPLVLALIVCALITAIYFSASEIAKAVVPESNLQQTSQTTTSLNGKNDNLTEEETKIANAQKDELIGKDAGEVTGDKNAVYTDGTFEGTGKGFRGNITVSVEVQNDIIKNIQIVSSSDDKKYLDKASSTVINNILNAQSADVDGVSGATFSSNGIKNAVKDALSKASTGKTDSVTSSGNTGSISLDNNSSNSGASENGASVVPFDPNTNNSSDSTHEHIEGEEGQERKAQDGSGKGLGNGSGEGKNKKVK